MDFQINCPESTALQKILRGPYIPLYNLVRYSETHTHKKDFDIDFKIKLFPLTDKN